MCVDQEDYSEIYSTDKRRTNTLDTGQRESPLPWFVVTDNREKHLTKTFIKLTATLFSAAVSAKHM